MKLSKNETQALAEVYKSSSNGIEPFTLYRRLRIGFSLFNKIITKLIQNELLTQINNKLSLSKEAVELIHQNRALLIENRKLWREVPTEYLQHKVEINSLYIPSRSKLDARHFTKK